MKESDNTTQSKNNAYSNLKEANDTVENVHANDIKFESINATEDSSKSQEGQVVSSMIRIREEHYIGHFDEAHHFIKDNDYIHHGYRINFHSCGKILKSLCMCHNETVNIWTHLFGALFVSLLIIITGISVGPYGDQLNETLSIHSNLYQEYFKNYSDPFLSSKGVLHNTKLILKNLIYYSVHLKSTAEVIGKSSIEDDKIITKYFDVLFKNNHKLNKINDELKLRLEKTQNSNETFKCFSCIQDFIDNLSSINKTYSELKFLYESKFIKESQSKYINQTFNEFTQVIGNINKMLEIGTEKIQNEYDFTLFNNFNKKTSEKFSLVKWPIYIHLCCAIICLSCSSSFHLFFAHSAVVSEVLARLDYAGISILIAGSCYAPYFYMFYCTTRKFYFLKYILSF
jgi:adiponectin receptor